MKAVIMAGGKGTRLKEITKDEIPKPMAKILDKPILEYQIEVLRENNVLELIIVIGHLGNKIKKYFKDGRDFGVNITYIEEKEPLGTAGAFYYLKEYIKEDFILLFGDLIFDIYLKRMIEFHEKKASFATLFVHPNSHPYDSDIVLLDEDNKIVGFDSKNNIRNYFYDNCVNAGIYIISNKLLNKIDKLQKIDLEKDILSKEIEKENMYGYYSSEYVKDVGTVERINKTSEDIQNNILKKKNLKNRQKCIFLDRDGTINIHKGLITNPQEIELEKYVAEAIRKINSSEFITVVITNQPQVARGLCSLKDIENINKRLKTLLGENGVYVEDVYFCPHHPDKGYPEENKDYKIKCKCRKPDIELIEKAKLKYNIDLENSWFIGDTTIDIQTGINANMNTILLNTGEAGRDGKYNVKPDYVCNNILDAVNIIID